MILTDNGISHNTVKQTSMLSLSTSGPQ